MITQSERNIPDPPVGPPNRSIREGEQPESRHYRHRRIPMPPRWLLFISHKILTPIGVLASLVYLWDACHR